MFEVSGELRVLPPFAAGNGKKFSAGEAHVLNELAEEAGLEIAGVHGEHHATAVTPTNVDAVAPDLAPEEETERGEDNLEVPRRAGRELRTHFKTCFRVERFTVVGETQAGGREILAVFRARSAGSQPDREARRAGMRF